VTRLTLVTGAGGFIGGQSVGDLLGKGIAVRAVDKKPLDEWYCCSQKAENVVADLQLAEACDLATRGVAQVYPAIWAAWASSKTTEPGACYLY
jgi:GDP-D-mannose 3', 5'-epimerase